ncbi:protein transport protein Sec61p [Trichomonascus vanleenenianus]|uniref:protein transport protein Sec61p n=1 Tax=Trichomonascus vanleenenianus TaxID=2268995 RepID=UPI003ECA52D9
MSRRLRLLDLVKPFMPILPEIEAPYQKVAYEEKLAWTVGVGIAYYVLSEIPLYGVTAVDNYDPLYWLRPIVASTKGSLMEIGTTPIITSGILLQVLGGLQFIDVHFDFKSDRELYQTAQKLLAIVLTVVHALAILFSGLYGNPSEMGVSTCILLVSQLVGTGLFVIYMDEIMQKGYSAGSATTLFSVLNVSQSFLWRTLSLQTEDFGRGKEFTGALVALVHLLWTRRSFKSAIIEAFYRTHLPNMLEFFGSAAVLVVVVYIMCFRYEVSIKSTKVRSPATTYPIRLLYTGNVPLYLVSAITANIFLFSQALYNQFPENLLVRLFGTWAVRAGSHQISAVSGLAYYLSPPFSIYDALWDPIRTIVYASFVIVTCVAFARTWAELSGGSARDVAQTFKDQSIVIVGHRDVSVVRELKRIIPVAAAVGGGLLALVSIASDVLGSAGNGTAVTVAVIGVYSYFEILAQESGSPNGFIPGQ